jgi:transcriptional antiterminator RfaH
MMAEGYWAVCQCEAQREHTARMLLMKERFETYAPRFKSKLGRILLLFPTYIFVRIIDRWYPVLWTPGVTRVLMAGDRPAQLNEQIVTSIKRREVGGLVRLPSNGNRLRKGDKVKITRGSFEGQIGIYDGMTPHQRERVLLELLGAWVPVELAATDVTPIKAVP